MMSKRFVSLSLVVAAAGALSLASACSSSSSGSSGTPTPTPTTITDCEIIWQNQNPTNSNNVDEYFVGLPVASWQSGASTYDATNNVGIYVINLDFTSGTVDAAGEATNGDFTLTVAGTAANDSASFNDTAAQQYWDAAGSGTTLGGLVGSGGTGSFTGTLADPNNLAISGSGTITVNIGTSGAMQFGDGGGGADAALCYDANAFGPMSPVEKALMFGRIAKH